jgi:hypothetical protein
MLLGCAGAAAQTDFEWRGQMASGQTIEIKGVNGNVRAMAAVGNEVEVTATRSARRSYPADVRFDAGIGAAVGWRSRRSTAASRCSKWAAPDGYQPVGAPASCWSSQVESGAK